LFEATQDARMESLQQWYYTRCITQQSHRGLGLRADYAAADTRFEQDMQPISE